MEKHIMGENGISYTLGEDGLYYPDLYLPEETEYPIGKYGICDAVICAFGRWISQKEPLPPKEFVNMMKSCIKVVAITQERMENE